MNNLNKALKQKETCGLEKLLAKPTLNSDIRNKLSPVKNLVVMVEHTLEEEAIDGKIKELLILECNQVKKTIEYLINLK